MRKKEKTYLLSFLCKKILSNRKFHQSKIVIEGRVLPKFWVPEDESGLGPHLPVLRGQIMLGKEHLLIAKWRRN